MAVKSLIETVTVGAGGASSIEFTAIPQDGSDLVCVISARSSVASRYLKVSLNNDTGSNYSRKELYGSGSGVSSFSSTTLTGALGIENRSDQTANTFGNTSIYISNYTSSSAKSISVDGVNENNAAGADAIIGAYSYSGTSPIADIDIVCNSGGILQQYSTASLYKIKYD